MIGGFEGRRGSLRTAPEVRVCRSANKWLAATVEFAYHGRHVGRRPNVSPFPALRSSPKAVYRQAQSTGPSCWGPSEERAVDPAQVRAAETKFTHTQAGQGPAPIEARATGAASRMRAEGRSRQPAQSRARCPGRDGQRPSRIREDDARQRLGATGRQTVRLVHDQRHRRCRGLPRVPDGGRLECMCRRLRLCRDGCSRVVREWGRRDHRAQTTGRGVRADRRRARRRRSAPRRRVSSTALRVRGRASHHRSARADHVGAAAVADGSAARAGGAGGDRDRRSPLHGSRSRRCLAQRRARRRRVRRRGGERRRRGLAGRIAIRRARAERRRGCQWRPAMDVGQLRQPLVGRHRDGAELVAGRKR